MVKVMVFGLTTHRAGSHTTVMTKTQSGTTANEKVGNPYAVNPHLASDTLISSHQCDSKSGIQVDRRSSKMP